MSDHNGSDAVTGRMSGNKKIIKKLVGWYVEPLAAQVKVQQEQIQAIGPLAGENRTRLEEMETKREASEAKREASEAKLSDVIIQQKTLIAEMERQRRSWDYLKDQGIDIGEGGFPGALYKKSYAQSGEDGILAHIFMMLSIPLSECCYLDLGANRPKESNNTYYLYEHGARGVLVEANPQLIPALQYYRNDDRILNYCIGETSGGSAEFIIMNYDGLSTISEEAAQEVIRENPKVQIADRVHVPIISVTELLDTYFASKAPNLMSVDIEGNDLAVLRSIDFSKYRPQIVIVEMIPYSTHLVVDDKNKDIYHYMLENNYSEYAFTGINSIFIDQNLVKSTNLGGGKE